MKLNNKKFNIMVLSYVTPLYFWKKTPKKWPPWCSLGIGQWIFTSWTEKQLKTIYYSNNYKLAIKKAHSNGQFDFYRLVDKNRLSRVEKVQGAIRR